MVTEEELTEQLVKDYVMYCGKLNEFYQDYEINDFCLETTELVESDLVIKCFEKLGLEFPGDIANLVVMSKINDKLKHAYEKNLEAIKYGFGNVKIPLEPITAVELVEETKSLKERLSE